MPAIYGFTVSNPPTRPRPIHLTPVLRLTGGNGDTITFNQWNDGYAAGARTSGIFGVDPRDVRRRAGVGNGTRWAGTRRQERPIDFEARILSKTVATQRQRLDRLADILDDQLYGPATLTVLAPEGGQDAARSIPVHYLSGMDGATDVNYKTDFERVPLSLIAPQPLFRADTTRTVTWTVASEKPFLSDTVAFFPAVLGSGRVLGQVALDNPGDAESPAVWTITGPGGPVTIQDGAGRGFTLDVTLAPGETRVVDTDAGTVVDGDGVNRYEDLATSPPPWLWAIPPHQSTATVDITNAGEGASVVLEYRPQHKRGW